MPSSVRRDDLSAVCRRILTHPIGAQFATSSPAPPARENRKEDRDIHKNITFSFWQIELPFLNNPLSPSDRDAYGRLGESQPACQRGSGYPQFPDCRLAEQTSGLDRSRVFSWRAYLLGLHAEEICHLVGKLFQIISFGLQAIAPIQLLL